MKPGPVGVIHGAGYGRLVRSTHPDLFAQATPAEREAANSRMAELNAAFRMLQDPVELARYRALRRRRPPAADARPAPPPSQRNREQERERPREPDPDFDYRERAPSEFDMTPPATERIFTANRPPRRRGWWRR